MTQSFIKYLEIPLNYYLQLDPESKARLGLLNHKTVKINLAIVQQSFYLCFTADKIELHDTLEAEPDTVITGTPLTLFRLSQTRTNREKFFSDDVSITGDLELAQQVINLFDHLEIDWEEYLSRCVGDVPAHQLGRVGRHLINWGKQVKDAFTQNLNEYVHEEKDLFPAREALQDFFNDVDALRMDVDRVEARLRLLQAHLDEKGSSA